MYKLWQKFLTYFSRNELDARGGYREIWQTAYPLIILGASNTFMMFCDRLMLAKRSTLDVAASMPSGILNFTLFCFFMTVCNYTGALVAQFFGANQKKDCVRATWNGFYLGCVFAVFILLCNRPIGKFIIEHFSADDAELKARGLIYFNVLVYTGALVVLQCSFFAYFNGQGRTKPAALINSACCLLNVLLDYWLIFGYAPLGIPEMGIYGAGLATLICTAVGTLAIVLYFWFQNQTTDPTRRYWGFRGEYWLKLLRYGSPFGLQTLLDLGSFSLILLLFGQYGREALGASVIAMSINNIFFTPLAGFSDATTIVVGQHIGARRIGTATKVAYRSWRMAMLYMIFGAILYIGCPQLLTRLFSPSDAATGADYAQVESLVQMVLLFLAVFNFTDSTKFVFGGVLRGAGDTTATMLINLITAWGLSVPGLLLIASKKWDFKYLWFYMITCGLLECLLFFWRFRTGHWKKIKLIQHTPKKRTRA